MLAAVAPDSIVRTDGWTDYDNLTKLSYRHDPLAIQGDQSKTETHLPMIHIVFGNLDAWLLGTHHGVSPKHLQTYLNEFVFRFNRRFWPMVAFDSVLKIASQAKAPTYEEIQTFIAHSKSQAIRAGSVPRWYESLHQTNLTQLAATTPETINSTFINPIT